MILDDNGKFSSLRTTEENKKLLLDEMARLSPAERAVFKHMLQEKLQAAPGNTVSAPAAGSQASIYDALGAAEFKHKPVDLETFVYDPYFLGETCSSLYPALFQDLQNIFTQGYNEVILTGSIGYGKSFVSSIGLARILYELSCLKNPQKSYGLAPNSMISILILSVNETLALKVAFEYIISKLELSGYFEKEFPYKKLKKEIKFPSNILVIARATTDTSALGMNPIAAMLDELNFLRKLSKSSKTQTGQKYDQAEAIYNVIKRRMKSRFEKKGRLPGVMFLASSKNTFDDFTARRVREAKSDPKIYVVDRTVWEVRPEDFDMTKGFKVLAGNEVVPSKVLDDSEVEAAEVSCPEGAAVVWVPDEFRADFDRDLEGALRDIAGRATAAISPFISRREKIAHAESLIPGRVHPYSTEALEMGKPGTFLWNLMVKALPDRETGRQELKPIFSPDQIRHAHIDTSLRADHTGLCFKAGTKVLMATLEERPIESIRIGDFVIDAYGSPQRVTTVFRRSYKGPLSVVKAQGGVCLYATPEHPILGIKRESVRRPSGGLLNPGRTVPTKPGRGPCPAYDYRNYEPEFIPAGDLRKSDYLALPKLNRTCVPAWLPYVSQDFGDFSFTDDLCPKVEKTRGFDNDKWVMHPVTSVTSEDFDGEVYNLETTGSHTYIAERVGVHNCVAHICGYKDVVRRNEEGMEYMERAPIFYVDLSLEIVPPPGGEIVLGDVRRLLYEMTQHGYLITKVTTDTYQSADTIQQLMRKGYDAEILSVDTSTDPYENLKLALYEDRVILYPYPTLQRELRSLERNYLTNKIDHPPRGCFVGSTRIPLLDGTFPQIEELEGKDIWVYSAKPNGTIVPGRARGRKTKKVIELVDIVLDSGAVERCTPEHLWMLRDGSYKEARTLRPGIDRLMPIVKAWPVNGGFKSWEAFLAAPPGNNHKVRAVIRVILSEPQWVYDLEVEEWSNFALASGVVVHNSKDISDALAGSLYSLQQAFLEAPLPFFGSSTKNIASLLEHHQQSMAGAIRENPVASQPIPLGGTLPFPDGILPPFLTTTDQEWDFYEP